MCRAAAPDERAFTFNIMEEEKINKLIGIGLITLLTIAIFIAILQPHYEAKAFNKFKSESLPQATYWDALFSKLRIESR